ncbi:MAG: DmsE family decaheme c-type cytochrome [Candidatus Rokubacteria bacterium]|nr:DmsE family decaheme c-type cytochrome [Candidatus Rokubacteria bacterium]
MARRGGSLLGVIPAVALLLLLVTLVIASCARAQRPPAQPAAAAAPPDAYIGAEICKACHEDQFAKFSRTKMGRLFLNHPRNEQERLGCESCHGPGKAHVEAGGGKGVGGLISFSRKDPAPVEQRNAVCLTCHEKTARLFWQGSPHESRDVACTNCHRVMEEVSPRFQLARATEIETCGQCHLERRAQQMRFSHMPLREGKMTCTSCHNPHGTVTPALLKENSVNDTCYTCHAEKRGPFLWEHVPVTESCTNCHDPHGSNHEKMLKLAKPRLCQQCHIETRHPTRPYGLEPVPSNLKFVLGRQCTNCHVNIHGSNHPSGFAFTR